ncbi:hypothetical protein FOA43_000610 [Brettanomyces nanus]|uniref:C2H2-type domain-containing protein n=1 Tax=Eeniella nana TaxID=13502 RepID=A0A875RN81_EENNA|nr:uncharacterized protein FOA43_000610 [Brettanomyces nanus]QPG73300.1 hypothetical protein FOA43_000610 [Brettanomyces nanus]
MSQQDQNQDQLLQERPFQDSPQESQSQQQQQQRQQQQPQSYDSRNTDELMDFVPISSNMDPTLRYPPIGATTRSGGTIPPSFSNSTISSVSSIHNHISPSLSSNSLTASATNNDDNLNVINLNIVRTPLKNSSSSSCLRKKSAGNLMATPAQTPVRRGDLITTPRRLTMSSSSSYRRVRLSEKSPANGNNPFYTPPAFLSPKITKHRKQSSISTSISLGHLDTDIQLQQHHRLSISPLATPLRTPSTRMDGLRDEQADADDGDDLDMDPAKTFIEPALLMKESSGSSHDGIKFGGKLSDLDAYSQQQIQERHLQRQHSSYDGSNSFINQDLLNNPQDIMLLIDSDNVEDAHSNDDSKIVYTSDMQSQYGSNRLPRTKSMPPQNGVSTIQVGPQILRRKLARSRSTMNLSEIAASKEAKTAALRTSSIHQSFTISELPEAALQYMEEESQDPNQKPQQQQSPHRMMVPQVPHPVPRASSVSSSTSIPTAPEYMGMFPTSIYTNSNNPLTQYMTPPSTAASAASAASVFHAQSGKESLPEEEILQILPPGLKRTQSKRLAENKKGKGKTRQPTTLILTDFERSKLDLPEQSARSKSRSKKGSNEKKKIHECPLCHSRFQRPEHVKRHMRSHSSEKPFACPQLDCCKRFNRKDNLKQHLRKIHGLKP